MTRNRVRVDLILKTNPRYNMDGPTTRKRVEVGVHRPKTNFSYPQHFFRGYINTKENDMLDKLTEH